MAGRRLSPDEAALWARVKASVRPLRKGALAAKEPVRPEPVEGPAPSATGPFATRPSTGSGRTLVGKAPVKLIVPPPPPQNTLDGGWDKRLARGAIVPDSTLDLHGHNLRSAHALLDTGLDRAIRRGDRVLLLVTGKPPRAESERPHARGAIRAGVADWLVASRHNAAIAAVRNAHPRHGGQGALYVILRRAKTSP